MANNSTNSRAPTDVLHTDWDDATWILTSSFIIFTMQTGFGLLEAGAVGTKNEVNIMVKNAVDVIYGGLTYWLFGYGLSFGMDPWSNPFIGWGHFCVDSSDPIEMGQLLPSFVFQLSFATTATTIVSGAMAERTKLKGYILFSLLNTLVYCIPAHWVWADNGFLKTLGVVDFAGSGVVHLLGAVSALVAALILGPRRGRFDAVTGDDHTEKLQPGNPASAMIGMFMLWWGWLAFNCGSTYGISGGKWILASKAAIATLNSSIAGGFVGILYTVLANKGKFHIEDIINSVLGGLVSITASCAMVRPWEALVIGGVGGLLTILAIIAMEKLHIDDPVSAFPVHGVGGVWGMVVVGLFADFDPLEDVTGGRRGLFRGGGAYLLGVQLLAVVCIAAWSALLTFIMLFTIHKTIGLRLSPEEEELGCDFVEHGIIARNLKNQSNIGSNTTSCLTVTDDAVSVARMPVGSTVGSDGVVVVTSQSENTNTANNISHRKPQRELTVISIDSLVHQVYAEG